MKNLESHIDHTNLKPDASKIAIDQLCREAMENNFVAVCVSPYHVKTCVEKLKNTDVKIATVIGFPMGYATTPAKVEELKRAIDDGADEIDMVINIQALKAKDLVYVKNDIESLCTYAHLKNHILKVIIEIGLLTQEEIIAVCKICEAVGVDFVKTSTGVIGRGATTADIVLLRKLLPAKIKIKASGGIKDKQTALDLIEAGADRIGSSSSVTFFENES